MKKDHWSRKRKVIREKYQSEQEKHFGSRRSESAFVCMGASVACGSTFCTRSMNDFLLRKASTSLNQHVIIPVAIGKFRLGSLFLFILYLFHVSFIGCGVQGHFT
jgi:hypothetical protein